MSIFGDLISGHKIDDAVKGTLETWMPTYLKEVARQEGLSETFESPRSYRAVSEFDSWPEEQSPSVVIVNPGIADAPHNQGGSYTARWPVTVCIAVTGKDQDTARRNSQLYIAAARGCLMQRRSLGAGMRGTDWGGEDYTLLDIAERRSRAGAKASFTVEHESVLSVGAGPTDPDLPEQPGEWPTVESAKATVTRKT